MQISTNQFYNSSNAMMSQLTEQADKLQTQISTTKRLQAPSDDPVAYQQLQLLARQTSNDTAYQTNVSTAQSLLTQSDSTLSSVVSQIQRAQELAVQANSGTLDDDRARQIRREHGQRSRAVVLEAVLDVDVSHGRCLSGGLRRPCAPVGARTALGQRVAAAVHRRSGRAAAAGGHAGFPTAGAGSGPRLLQPIFRRG